MRLPKLTLRDWLIAVAILAVLFACIGVGPIALLVGALTIAASISRPSSADQWLILGIGAVAALPWMLPAHIYSFAVRTAVFLGRWPYFNHPDPKDLPARFNAESWFEVLIMVLIPAAMTCLFVCLCDRFVPAPRLLAKVLVMAAVFWLLAFAVLILDPVGVLEWIMD